MNEKLTGTNTCKSGGGERKTLLPGATIGIVGGGQLGRMLAIEAKKLGYVVGILDPEPESPAAQVADFAVVAGYDDGPGIRSLAARCDVLTFEFENVSASVLGDASRVCRVFPPPSALHIAQNREREKLFLKMNGFPCARFEVVHSAASLREAVQTIGLPCVLKTADFGYDGKGQRKLDAGDDLDAAWTDFGGARGVLEEWVPYVGEYSVVCARSEDGTLSHFPPSENFHRNHILDAGIVPARWALESEETAISLARQIADALKITGLLAVEMFLLADGSILVNELAPRPHNSGHYSFGGCVTSQFEQHVRAVCGLPHGATTLRAPVVMVNLLGDLWRNGEPPDWSALLAIPNLKLHLYGKASARPGRKMGHFCVDADTPAGALRDADAARALLGLPPLRLSRQAAFANPGT